MCFKCYAMLYICKFQETRIAAPKEVSLGSAIAMTSQN